MIEAFIESWPLFQNTYLTGWSLSLLLALIGVVVVARDQVFLGLAVSQASLLGVASGMWLATLFPQLTHLGNEHAWWLSLCSMAFAMVAAVVTSRQAAPGRETPESITGWVYAFTAALAVLLLSRSPHGLEEVHRLLSSTIIGASSSDVVLFVSLLAVSLLGIARWRESITLLVMDAEMAGAVGLSVRRWQVFLSLWAAIVVGLSIRVSGLLFTFGCLVLPSLVAKNLVREVRAMFWVAPLISLGSTFCAFVAAHGYDFPPGQLAVAIQGLLLLGGWSLRRSR
ncbi:MAG: hypothetical protein KatS3mg077_0695 [Candidatus Binatia bacterium]|nr:MAG: hypothetical protein KatS3mg077_0695 [Candidatus Binatia bacterium]